jgi:uncharacterized protein YecE (DUF72 family)
VLEVRHPTFIDPAFVALARKYGATICLADHFTYPMIADVSGDVVYARLQTGSDDVPTAYAPKDLDAWVDRFRTYAQGKAPGDLDMAAPGDPAPVKPRDVYAFVIHEGKVRAPAAAMAMIEKARS